MTTLNISVSTEDISDSSTFSPSSSSFSFDSAHTPLTVNSLAHSEPHFFIHCPDTVSPKDLASVLAALPLQDGKGQYLLLAAEIANLRGIHNPSEASSFEDALTSLGRALGDDAMFSCPSRWSDVGDEMDISGKQCMLFIFNL